MTTSIEFIKLGLKTDQDGALVKDNGKFVINDLSAVSSTKNPIDCFCNHCGHKWSWVRFTEDRLDERIAFALEAANTERPSDYRSINEAAGRMLNLKIDGIGGAEGSDKLQAAVAVLWEGNKVTDAFTLKPGVRAFNHAFGYMGACCFKSVSEKLEQINIKPDQIGLLAPDELRLQFGRYGYEGSELANNDGMMKWFEVAAQNPIIPYLQA